MFFNHLLLTIDPAFLFYTDPGSGALLFQIIMATLLGGLFYFRKLKDWIFRKNQSPSIEDDSPASAKNILESKVSEK